MASAAIVGGSVLGAGISAYGANKAAKQQARSQDRSLALQKEMYDTGREDLFGARDAIIEGYRPYVQQGRQASDLSFALSGAGGAEAQREAYDQFVESPGVQWLRDQGTKKLEQDLSVSGVGGGTRLKALSRFNQGLAEQSFADYYGRIAGQADAGRSALGTVSQARLNAAGSTAQLGQNRAQLGSTALTNRGNALASGTQAVYDTAGSFVSDLGRFAAAPTEAGGSGWLS